MSIAIVGGIRSLERKYKDFLKKKKYRTKIFNQMQPEFVKRIKAVDAVIIFSDTVSHKLAVNCRKVCKKNNICLINSSAGSICNLEKAVDEVACRISE